MKSKRRFNSSQAGLLLIEIILATAIFGIISLIILSAFVYGRQATALAGDAYNGAEIANAAIEAVSNIAQSSYSNLADYTDGTTYYLTTVSNQWSLITTPTAMNNIFTPAIVFSEGPDGTRQAKVTVSWVESAQETPQVSATTIFSNWTAPT
ncbi:MAG TPA: hypothetical protein VMR34_02695 [Candidatus Saccharimonadales bacterium]|nr:hypothetical protein [Candidatus Saccharimonadales bacterium]